MQRSYGYTALFIASEKGHIEIVKLLKEKIEDDAMHTSAITTMTEYFTKEKDNDLLDHEYPSVGDELLSIYGNDHSPEDI